MHFFFSPNSSSKKLLLDGLTGLSSTGAYSLRKLSKSAVNAITVRRSSDNTEQTIGFAGNDLDSDPLLNFVGGENLIFPSELFGSWSFSNSAISATDTEVAPDGTSTADTAKLNSSTGVHSLYKDFTLAPTVGVTYVMSFYVKAGTTSLVQIATGVSDFGGAYANFDLASGTLTAESVGTGAITALANGWFRISLTAVCASATGARMSATFINSTTATRNPSFAGNNTDTFILWGAQVNTVSLKTYVKSVSAICGDGYVTTWYDQSGNSRHVSQPTAARQPKIMTNGILYTRNNRPVIEWYSSTQSFMNLNTIVSGIYPANTRRHTHMVCNVQTGLGANSRMFLNASRSASTSDWAITAYTLLGQDGGAYASTTPTLVPISYDVTRIMAFSGVATFSAGHQYIGNLDDGTTARSFYGSITEFIHFGATISDTQRTVLDKSMSKYYGIPLA